MTDDTTKAVMTLWRQGVTYSEIGARHGLSRGQVAGIIHRSEAKLRDARMRRHVRPDRLPMSYFEQGLSLAEMVEDTKIPVSTLKDWRQGR